MWLINTTTLQLEYVHDPEIYTYAILSHTWGDGEITFSEMADIEQAGTRPGVSKIRRTCQLAKDRGISYAWVDTCCIDKRSSAELSESINSMYRWYKMSAVCFVFLSDLPSSNDRNVMDDHFARCRWFNRGWTLQELIAPHEVEFYDQEWIQQGNKATLQRQLSEITRIDIEILGNSDLVSTVSVAKRMSWASTRQTTRVEDLSYCLFGIFDVNLPLIYGEGEKAFIRLQEAIALNDNDLSLFAWTARQDDPALRGLLAKSPSEFIRCGSIQKISSPIFPGEEFGFTNKGFHIQTRLSQAEKGFLLNLQCIDTSIQQSEEGGGIVFIRLLKTSHGFVRHQSHLLAVLSLSNVPPSQVFRIYIPRTVSVMESRLIKSRLSHCFTVDIVNTSNFLWNVVQAPEHLWENGTKSFITDGNEKFVAILYIEIENYRSEEAEKENHIGMLDWEHKSSYVVVLGLDKSHNVADGGVSEEDKFLKPWAAIYKNDHSEDVSRILSQEEWLGQPHVLTRVGEFLRSRASSGQLLPVTLKFNPAYTNKSGSDSTSRIVEEPVELSLSTKVTRNGGLNLYEVEFRIER